MTEAKTWRAGKPVEVEREEDGGEHWCIYAADSDYPIATLANEADALYVAALWNAALGDLAR